MTAPQDGGRLSPFAKPARVVRRVLAPAGLELEGELRRLREEFGRLHAEDEQLRRENAELRSRLDGAERRLAAVEEQLRGPDGAADQGLAAAVRRLSDGLKEERRLQLRVAELTDLVTELVLPLHDRDIDPSVLRSLRPDTM